MDITTSILLTVILLILSFCLYNWLCTSWDYWTSRGIPSVPGPVPIFGNALPVFRLQENLSIFTKNIYDAYKGKSMVGLYNLTNPVLMVRDPNLVKTVMQTSFNNFQHNEIMLDLDADPLVGRDPFFVRGQAWKESRATFVSALSAGRVKNMSLVIANVCKILKNHLAENIKNKDYLELDAKFLFSRYTTEVAAGSVFGIEGKSFADDYKGTLLDSMKITLDPTKTKALLNNIMFFLPALSKFFKTSFVSVEVDKYFRSVVKNVENLRQKDGVARNDVLQLMLDLENNGKISRIDVLAHTFSFFIESYETSSLALSFMSYFIAKHREIQNRLRAEVETVLAKYEGELTYEAINEMNYMELVMNETLRFYPAVGVLSKVCAEEYRLEGSDGLAVEVKPGTTVLIPVLGLQMDPDIWENPEEFNPERFAKVNNKGSRKFCHLPFGEGPRACPGQRLAVLQVKAAIATILRNYCIELSPKMQDPIRIDPAYFLITVIGGFWIKLRSLKKMSTHGTI